MGIQHVSYMGKTTTIIVIPGKLLAIDLGSLMLLVDLWFVSRAGRKKHLARARHGAKARTA